MNPVGDPSRQWLDDQRAWRRMWSCWPTVMVSPTPRDRGDLRTTSHRTDPLAPTHSLARPAIVGFPCGSFETRASLSRQRTVTGFLRRLTVASDAVPARWPVNRNMAPNESILCVSARQERPRFKWIASRSVEAAAMFAKFALHEGTPPPAWRRAQQAHFTLSGIQRLSFDSERGDTRVVRVG